MIATVLCDIKTACVHWKRGCSPQGQTPSVPDNSALVGLQCEYSGSLVTGVRLLLLLVACDNGSSSGVQNSPLRGWCQDLDWWPGREKIDADTSCSTCLVGSPGPAAPTKG